MGTVYRSQQNPYGYEGLVGFNVMKLIDAVSLNSVLGPTHPLHAQTAILSALILPVAKKNTAWKKRWEELTAKHQREDSEDGGQVSEQERLEQLELLIEASIDFGILKPPKLAITGSEDTFKPLGGDGGGIHEADTQATP